MQKNGYCLLVGFFMALLGGVAADAQVSNTVSFTESTSLLFDPTKASAPSLAVTDLNQDGLDDIVIHESVVPRIEYQQADGGAFIQKFLRDGGAFSSPSGGLAIGDTDDNGMPDLLFNTPTGNWTVHFRADNTGGSYRRFNVPDGGFSTSGTVLSDIDGDGSLDLYNRYTSKLRNDGSGQLQNDLALIGNQDPTFSSRCVLWTDYDNDGDSDLVIAGTNSNNPQRGSQLYRNDGGNQFVEIAVSAGLPQDRTTTAVDFADVDNDGDLDCFFGTYATGSSVFLTNNGDGTLSDATVSSGIDISWDVRQCVFRDFNNDGWIDLLATGEEDGIWLNDRDGTFTKVADPLSATYNVRSFAIGDLNHDGFPDIYAAYPSLPSMGRDLDHPDELFLSNSNGNAFLSVTLLGRESNRLAGGARIELHGPWGVQVREVRMGHGRVSHSLTQLFGMGDTPSANQIVIRWPSGAVDTIAGVSANQFLVIEEGDSLPPSLAATADLTADLGASAQLQLVGTDPTGNELSYSATGLPQGLSIDHLSGLISGTTLSERDFAVTVTVEDGWSSVSQSFNWTVGAGGPGGDMMADYSFDSDGTDASPNNLDLTASGNVVFANGVATFDAVGDQLSVTIPDSLLLPEAGVPLVLEGRIRPQAWLGYGVDNLPVISLSQEWNSSLALEDQKWGSSPQGPNIQSSGGVLATAAQVATALTIGQWNQISIAYDGASTVSFSVDGVLVSQANLPPDIDRNNDWTLVLGNFDGDLDDVRIFGETSGGGGDLTAPVPVLTTVPSPVSSPFVVDVVFDEPVTGFDASDFRIRNATISGFYGFGTDFQIALTPNSTGALGEGTVSVSIPAGVANDLAGNSSAGSDFLRIDYDIVPSGEDFSRTPDADTIALYHLDYNATDASANNLDLSTTGTVEFVGGAARFDALGDQLTVTIPDSLVLPASGQPVSIHARIRPRAWLGHSIDDFPVVSLHQEYDSNFALEDTKWGTNPKGPNVRTSNGVLVDNVQWANVAFTNEWHSLWIWYDGISTVYCAIDGVVINSAALPPNDGRTSDWTLTLGNFDGDLDEVYLSRSIIDGGRDVQVPSVALSTPALTVSDTFTVTATFDEDVNSLLISDFVVSNGGIGGLQGSGRSYSFEVTPAVAGAVTVQLPAGFALDAVGNANTQSNLLSITYSPGADTQPPTVVLTTPAPTVNGAFPVTTTFNEAVTGLALGDIIVSNGTASSLSGSGASYTFTVTPTAIGAVTTQLPADAADDLAGNASLASNFLSVTYETGGDTQPPSVVLTTPSATAGDIFPVTVTFDEPVTGLFPFEFIIGNGAITTYSFSGSGASYSFEVTPAAPGPVTIQLPAAKALDLAGNLNLVSNLLSVTYATNDTEGSIPVLSTPSLTVDGFFTVTVTFNEPISGFQLFDIATSSGAFVNTLTGYKDVYTFQANLPLPGAATIQIPAGVVIDTAGNANVASNILTVVRPDTSGGSGVERVPDADTIALYHLNGTLDDASTNGLDLTLSGNVEMVSNNLSWMASPSGKVARFVSAGDTLAVTIPDSLVLPDDGSNEPLSIEAWIHPRIWRGFGVDDLPIVALTQEWDTHFELQDSKWGNNPQGPRVVSGGVPLATAAEFAAAAPLDEWSLLQIGFDGAGTVSAWINGVLASSVAIDPNLGRNNDWTLTLGNFKGDIDEVFVYHGTPIGVPPSSTITGASAALVAEAMEDSGLDPDSEEFGADPDGDGFSNQLEVAFGSDPLGIDVPYIRVELDAQGRTVVTYPAPIAGQSTDQGYESTAFSYTVETSENLSDWAPADVETVACEATERGFQSLRQRIVPAASGQRRFVRVSVEVR